MAYANVSFALFGDLVPLWLTLNEPQVVATLGYGEGIFAPGRCSNRSVCAAGNSVRVLVCFLPLTRQTSEPFIVAHHLLLAHARTVDLYRGHYAHHVGRISLALNSDWAEPLDRESEADRDAAERYLDFTLGWFAQPVTHGGYPASMIATYKNLLPSFTSEESELLKGSIDFFGLNHYTSVYVQAPSQAHPAQGALNVHVLRHRKGLAIGPQGASEWLYVVPWGLGKLLSHIHERYELPIWITENGVDVPGEDVAPLPSVLNDTFRSDYLRDYLEYVALAVRTGVRVEGYTVWSLLDNFEWLDGYTKRFGSSSVFLPSSFAHARRSLLRR